ncbi:hypothetical protein EAS64_13655 [Trebonia kvetii]|uniref:Uncharacterized protein n=1 Tax=Trebonia kvetii TaxID=2480626 RepID=A0A6P2C7Q3_9ACTN|nr:hypothetical protein [Trebonia kvetii]TVZ05563.1 hypothetical protein EAS64_13655 [Trebonia kvetii]
MTGTGGKPDALLLDEMFSSAIADDLAARGTDCRAVAADVLLRALSDLEIFETALLEVPGHRDEQRAGLRIAARRPPGGD